MLIIKTKNKQYEVIKDDGGTKIRCHRLTKEFKRYKNDYPILISRTDILETWELKKLC